jgi:hypothetical protein
MPPRPPLAETVKLELNWQNSQGRAAHNITYCLLPVGANPSDIPTLTALATALQGAVATSGIMVQLASTGHFVGVTATDNSGASDNIGTSPAAPLAGTGTSQALPPQVAICLSWQIPAHYRGGHPRWYIPLITANAQAHPDDSQLLASVATLFQGYGTSILNSFNATTVGGGTAQLGTISYHSGNVARPTPVFRPFTACNVHERLDSQRRRSGKESGFPVIL